MQFLIDNTVLSNFAVAGRLELIRKILGESALTTIAVQNEYQEGVNRGKFPSIELDFDVIELTEQEKRLMDSFPTGLHAGETSCLAAAIHRKGGVLTDDQDARKVAAQMQIPVSGTLGLLKRAVGTEVLALDEANALLRTMIASGYRSPISNFEELL
ncbi:MAG: DUF3368 domain-containing protein [Chloroflexota bacterium]